jgi:hypothetical protein
MTMLEKRWQRYESLSTSECYRPARTKPVCYCDSAVLFMTNTGVSPDEARRLEYRDVKIVKDPCLGKTILEIEVRVKRGVGFCEGMPGAVLPFQRRVKRNKPESTALLFGANHKKQFNRVLEDLVMKFDRDGNRRSAYSLRHIYICLRLIEGADIYHVAKNCSTSVDMIERYLRDPP